MARYALIVDDDTPSRKIYGGMLARLGFNVTEAVDGEHAISLLESSQPEVILLDLLLPKVNGLQVLDYIYSRAHLETTHVIIITAHTTYKHTLQLRDGDRYYTKPVAPGEIREYLVEILQVSPS